LIRGFVLNRFRGDAALLAPGPEQLRILTGITTVAVLPMWRGHGLPEEDGILDDAPINSGPTGDGPRIAIIAYPRLSNLDEFQPLRDLPGLRLIWARAPSQLEGVDWIILPGSKAVASDLSWLRVQGLDLAVARHAASGKRVLGICGGLQMLGELILDPHGLDGEARGLGLLPLVTCFETDKLLRATRLHFASLDAPWDSLSNVDTEGYEIHHGRTSPGSSSSAAVAAYGDAHEPIGWQAGPVIGWYAHGLFEKPSVMQALFGRVAPSLDGVFDALADFIDLHFEPGVLLDLLQHT
jgi:adenosylcobyric acid synthase